jgi:hypothetical protein
MAYPIRSSFVRQLKVVLSALALMLTCSCGKSGGGGGGGGTPNKPAVVPTPAPGQVEDSAGFFVEVLTGNESAKQFFNMHKGLATFDEPCKGELGKIVDCYLDAEEWTLFSQAYSLHYHVPSNMCSYVSFDPFYFVNRDTKWTTSLTKYTDKNGAIGSAVGADNLVSSTDFGCYTEKGDPVCCVGEYPERSFVWNTTNNAFDQPTVTIVNRTIDKCLGGPATTSQPKTKFGVPRRTFQFVEGKGISAEYKFDALVDHQVSTGWVANYFNPAEHGGGPPQAFDFDIDKDAGVKKYGQPYYTIACHDSAWETLATIRIQIREWNTKTNYLARKTEPTKHDEVGFESEPWATEGRNDSMDWLDFQLASRVHPGYEYQ